MATRLAELPITGFAREQLLFRLSRLTKEWRHCARNADEDAVHDLRVSLRRFGETLRAFRRFFPKRAHQQIREEIRQIMNFAGRTRDVDIARHSFQQAGLSLYPRLELHLTNERAVASAGLRAPLAVGLETDFAARWRRTLALDSIALPSPGVDS